MLAYELYQINKDSNRNPNGDKLIKKIFYDGDTIELDKKTPQEYGSTPGGAEKFMQDWLGMPRNSIDLDLLNLPDRRTSSGSPNPYIEAYGFLRISSVKKELCISIGKDKEESKTNRVASGTTTHVLDLDTGEITSKTTKNPVLKIDRERYCLESGATLFSEYVKSEILDGSRVLDDKKYDDIIRKFLNFAKDRPRELPQKLHKPIGFSIYILPSDARIVYDTSDAHPDAGHRFVDYFGNDSSCYPSTATQTAKFLSYDDMAFTINCKQGADFYRNLGMGNLSMEKAYLRKSQTFNISGLVWSFVDMSNPDDDVFVDTKRGILCQLYENYQNLVKGGHAAKAGMKVVCIKQNQAKQEILIDENLTMDRLESMFPEVSSIPAKCLELFIDTRSDKNPVWDVYIYMVQSFISGTKVQRNYMMMYFTRMLRHYQHQWLRQWLKTSNSDEPCDFFVRSSFCLKALLVVNDMEDVMSMQGEEFAERAGKMAKTYLEFKQKHKESNNSLIDMMTYSKYDREKLRFVLSRIGRGIQLSKVSDADKTHLERQISVLQPSEEIPDEHKYTDFSYFFFKGFYANSRP